MSVFWSTQWKTISLRFFRILSVFPRRKKSYMWYNCYYCFRLEFDAYRADLEELSVGLRDAAAMVRIEMAQQQYQIHKDKYERLHSDVSIKLKFLEENKVPCWNPCYSPVLFHKSKVLQFSLSFFICVYVDFQVKVMHKQLLLFHNAVSAYFAGNQQQLEQTLRQFNVKLKPPGSDKPSWLEEQWSLCQCKETLEHGNPKMDGWGW